MTKDANNLTYDQLVEVKNELESKGYKRAQGITVVEPGQITATVCTTTIGKKLVALFSAMTFKRKDAEGKELPLYWDAAKFDGVHKESGKSYTDIKVNLDDKLKEELNKPENLKRKCTLLSTPSTTNPAKTFVTFVMWN
jgi:hypothetical protein